MKPSRHVFVALLTLATASITTRVDAQVQQAFSLDRYPHPISLDDGISLRITSPLAKSQISFRLTAGYQHKPIVLENATTGETIATPVEHRIFGYASIAYGVTEAFGVYIQVPATLWQNGDFPLIDTAGIGDVTIGAQARLIGDGEAFGLGLEFELVEPTGNGGALSSDVKIGGRAGLRLDYAWTKWTLGINAGADFRSKRQWLSHQTGSDIRVAAGVMFAPTSTLRLSAEAFGQTGATNNRFFTEEHSRLEAGVSVFATPNETWMVGAASTFGLFRGVGTPRFRALITGGFRIQTGVKTASPSE